MSATAAGQDLEISLFSEKRKGKQRKKTLSEAATPKEASSMKLPDIAFKEVITPNTSSMPAQNGLDFHSPHPTGKTDAHVVDLRQETWLAL